VRRDKDKPCSSSSSNSYDDQKRKEEDIIEKLRNMESYELIDPNELMLL
jgi:hypothetical protein